ncbi:hypothetical protein [Streptomyces phaeoluteigriseus]
MRRLLEVLGFLSLVQGVAGLAHELTDLDRGLVQRLGVLDGYEVYEVYASVALLVLAFALFAAAESRKPG